MKLLTIFDYLINPNMYKIKGDIIERNNKNLIFWEGDDITVINTKNKTYKQFKITLNNQKRIPDSPERKRTKFEKIKDFFTNTIYLSANKWKIINIPKIKEKKLISYKTKYTGYETL